MVAGGKLSLDVWADDTARVTLIVDGVPTVLYSPDFSNTVCADGPIGCLPALKGSFMFLSPSASTVAVQMDVFQTGGVTTGLLYSGTVEAVPEPGSMALFGLGLGMIGVTQWRRRRSR